MKSDQNEDGVLTGEESDYLDCLQIDKLRILFEKDSKKLRQNFKRAKKKIDQVPAMTSKIENFIDDMKKKLQKAEESYVSVVNDNKKEEEK